MNCSVVYGFFNLVDQDETELSATNENSFFPLSNLKDPRSTKVFRSTGATDSVIFDFKTTEPVDFLCVRPDLQDGFAFTGDLTIEANITNEWTSPSYSTTLSVNTEYNLGIKILDTVESYRFWRVTGTGSSYFELSNIFIGQGFQAGKNASLNWNYTEKDLNKSFSNKFGQSFFDEYGTQKMIDYNIKVLTTPEMEELKSNMDYVGETKPVYIVMDNEEKFATDSESIAGMFYLKSPKYSNVAFDYWNTSVVLREAK